ncbi:hypothetical protein IAR55_001725 [Kwoniella newhampshirensis]|uniref:Uncharacterized protein n=1 Tax=Kwoniella newhampshirensis TaxID=1651941 RepID=A0AAW0Z2Z3_9TREE
MSLGVSPSSSSPLSGIHSRPFPPNRKRSSNSHTPSPRATPLSENIAQFPNIRETDSREEEDGLHNVERSRLESALREEWLMKDKLAVKVERVEKERDTLEMQQREMKVVMTGLQARVEQAFSEQSRMEADLEERDDLLERLRKRVGEAERQVRDSQKRYLEQEKSFDLERKALQAQEDHLQKRIIQLQKSSGARTPTSIPDSEDHNVVSLKDELASMNLSHSTLLAKLNTITKELEDLKVVNKELEEENEGWEFLIRERTLNGKVRQGVGFLGRDRTDSEEEEDASSGVAGSVGGRSGLESVDEDLDAEMEELNSDLEAQSPIFDDEHHFIKNIDERQGGFLAPPRGKSRGQGRKIKGDGAATSPVSSIRGGLDLAAELGMADGFDLDSRGKSEETQSLKMELKQLKEANKALTLYCSKIIDRIIAQDGFEHILSVDYKSRRSNGVSRSASGSSRPALKDIQLSVNPPTTVTPASPKKKQKKARPLSMMVRAMSGSVAMSPNAAHATLTRSSPSPTPSEQTGDAVNNDSQKETKSEKRARRGFSLDFRSLGFGSSAPEPNKSALKPLTLTSRSAQPSIPQRSTSGFSTTGGRKLEPHAEDEEDRKERHRMEATLKLMGIERSSPSPTIEEEPQEYSLPSGASWFSGGKKSTQVDEEPIRSSLSSSEGGVRKPNPSGATRVSSMFGTTEPASPLELVTVPDPKLAEAALRAFDERERERVKALADGRAEVGHTSPPRVAGGLNRISADKGRTVSKSESVKTLWSMGGGDSRPGSGEIVLERKEA